MTIRLHLPYEELPMVETLSAVPHLAEDVSRRLISACNLCGGTTTAPYCPQNGRGLVQCVSCGLVYVGQQPDAEALYTLYSANYFKNDHSGEVGYTNYAADEPNIRKTAHKRLAHIERFVPRGRLLDVGCALGFVMDVAHERGWQVEGLDVSQFAIETVKTRWGYTTYHGSLTEQNLPSAAYDAITMYDVIEHVPDPRAYVQEAARLLRAGGICELATPDIGSLPARLTGKRWIGYKLADEHVYYFSVATLTRMFNDAGFDVVYVRHVGKHVTLRLFLDRLGFYVPLLARPLQGLEQRLQLSQRSFYVNPLDIVAITARRRS